MLENAVFPIQDLRAVRDQASQLQVRLGTTITYDEYCSLLLSAASTYDAQFSTAVSSRGTRRVSMPMTSQMIMILPTILIVIYNYLISMAPTIQIPLRLTSLDPHNVLGLHLSSGSSYLRMPGIPGMHLMLHLRTSS